jgi:AraC-like DNA-binding protein
MKLFVSFTVLIVVTVICIYAISDREILLAAENAIGEKGVGNLKTADMSIQQLKDSAYKDCLNMALNNSVKSMGNYSTDSGVFSVDEVLSISQVLDTLMKLVQTYDGYQSIYLYLENFNYIFTSDNDLVAKELMVDRDWLKFYTQYKENKTPLTFINTRKLKTNNADTAGNDIYVTTYIYPLTPYTTSLDGAIVVNFKESTVSKILNGDNSGKNGSVLIINSEGEVISDIDKSILSKNVSMQGYIKSILSSKSSSGFFYSNVGQTKSLVSYYRSGFNDWIYVGVFPINVLMNKSNATRANTLIIAMIVMVLGILIAFFVSKKIYSPVDNMVKAIKSKKWVNLKNNEDEMSIIYTALNTISKGGGNSSQKKMQTNYINKMLDDDPPDEEDKNAFDEVFNLSHFICAIISIDLCSEKSEKFDEKQWSYIKYLIIEVSEEIIGQKFKCTGFATKKGEILIFCNLENQHTVDCVNVLHESFKNIEIEIAKILDNAITVGIGCVHSEMIGIRESYMEAQVALKQKMKLGLGKIIVWEEEFVTSNYYYPYEIEEQIRNYLDLGMNAELSQKVRDLIMILKSRENLACENIIHIITQMVGNTIIKYMIERNMSISDVYGINSNFYSEISRKETLDEIEVMLVGNYELLLDYCASAKSRKKNIDRMIEYIKENFKNDIGINDISEHMGLSYSHVRKIFKTELGMNIVDYINSMRIKEAKTLLLSKDLSIKSIAVAIGYNNDQSFERYFKKIVGITPGEFRTIRLSEPKIK